MAVKGLTFSALHPTQSLVPLNSFVHLHPNSRVGNRNVFLKLVLEIEVIKLCRPMKEGR